MEKVIISAFGCEIPFEALLSALHVKADDDAIETIAEIHRQAVSIANPKAVYLPVTPVIKDGEIWLNGICFKNEFVFQKLSQCGVVVPYVASCGRELESWSETLGDFYERFVADTIKQMYLFFIRDRLVAEAAEKHLTSHKKIARINPGSLKEWPITEQTALFKLLGNVKEDIGVELTGSFLMLPTKSSSGILFETDEDYENCQHCPRLTCPNRRAEYSGDITPAAH